MGLGPLSRVSLGEARKLATQYREMVREQIDPILARREEQRRRLLDISIDANVTFREAAEAFIRAHEPEWRNRKHSQQWGNTLKTYAYPIIGDVRVRDIDTAMIVRILQPIWTKKAETARCVRGRIKAILDAETVMGHRTGSNPARYVDHLQLVLPRSKKRSQVRHHAALPWEDLPTFIQELEQRPRRAARVLHLLVLTATRTNEARFARVDEFDLDNRVGSIPGDRTKSGRHAARAALQAGRRDCTQCAVEGEVWIFVSRLHGRAPTVEHGNAVPAETHVVFRDHRPRFSVDIS